MTRCSSSSSSSSSSFCRSQRPRKASQLAPSAMCRRACCSHTKTTTCLTYSFSSRKISVRTTPCPVFAKSWRRMFLKCSTTSSPTSLLAKLLTLRPSKKLPNLASAKKKLRSSAGRTLSARCAMASLASRRRSCVTMALR